MVAFLCAAAFVRRRAQRHPTTLDWTGFIALSLAIAALQLMLDRGERLGWFNSNEIILEAFVACLAFYVFVAHIFTTDRPFPAAAHPHQQQFRHRVVAHLCVRPAEFHADGAVPVAASGPARLSGWNHRLSAGHTRPRHAVCGFLFIMFYGQRIDPRLLAARRLPHPGHIRAGDGAVRHQPDHLRRRLDLHAAGFRRRADLGAALDRNLLDACARGT